MEFANFAEGVISDAIPAVVRTCPQLLHLGLRFSDISDAALQVVSQACPLLESLDLHACTGIPQLACCGSRISDVGIQAVARHCARLEELDVDECANLTDAAFLAVAQGVVHGCGH